MASRLKRNTALMASALTLIGGFEGLRRAAYLDPVGIPTICFGETRGVKMGDTATTDECNKMLGNRLLEFESGVRKCLRSPDTLPDGTYIAILSLSYNIGVGAFCNSTARKEFDAGNIKAGCDAFMRFNKVTIGGVRVPYPGLTNRRTKERDICLKGSV
jgi:lysozyme